MNEALEIFSVSFPLPIHGLNSRAYKKLVIFGSGVRCRWYSTVHPVWYMTRFATIFLQFIMRVYSQDIKASLSSKRWYPSTREILYFLIIFIYFAACCYFAEPHLCEGLTDCLGDGRVPRTPLLQPGGGQTIRTLAHGTYNVTGGVLQIGNLGNGHVTKIIGMAANGHNNMGLYTPGNQPFNQNFASVLYEVREAGQNSISHSMLDYA